MVQVGQTVLDHYSMQVQCVACICLDYPVGDGGGEQMVTIGWKMLNMTSLSLRTMMITFLFYSFPCNVQCADRAQIMQGG